MSGMTVRDIVLARLFGRVDGMMVSMPSGLKFVAEAMAEEPDMAGPVLRGGRWVVLGTEAARCCVLRLPSAIIRIHPQRVFDALVTASTLGEMRPISKSEMAELSMWLPDGSWKQNIPVEEE